MGFDSLGMVRAGCGGGGESSPAMGRADGEHRKGLKFPSVLLVLVGTGGPWPGSRAGSCSVSLGLGRNIHPRDLPWPTPNSVLFKKTPHISTS